MSTTTVSLSGMQTSQLLINQTADNIANASTPGFKASFSNLANIENNNGVYAIATNSMDVKGGLERTGLKGDLAIEGGKGYLVVKEKGSNGKIVNLATGSFKPNKEGELEYLGKYLLLGAKYGVDGSLPPYNNATLEPIFIDHNIISEAKASTIVTESFNLNSGLLAKGKGSFVLSPDAANRSPSQTRDDFLIEGGNLQNGSSFSVSIKEEQNGQITSKNISCLFVGAKASNSYTNSGTSFPTAATDELNITLNGIPLSPIKANQITGTDDAAKLSDLRDKLLSIGIRAQTQNDSTNNSTTLVIMPPVNSNDSLQISGTLATTLGITYAVTPTKAGSKRFSTMSDLENALISGFSDIKSNGSSDSLVFFASPDTNISFFNDGTTDVLQALGLEVGALKGQGYDPYDASQNMASGNMRADFSKVTSIYDSKGNSHLVTVALKKVEDGWIQEVYFNDSSQIVSDRTDGLVQVTKVTFDSRGGLSTMAPVVPTITSAGSVSNIFANLAPVTAGAASIAVAGVTFTVGTDFNSLADLAGRINQDPVAGAAVQATIVQEGNGFKLKIISKNSITPAVTTNNLSFNMDSTGITTLPSAADLELLVNFRPSEGLDRLALKFDLSSIKELAFKDMNGTVDADGNAPAAMIDYDIDNYGVVLLKFTDGSQKAAYKIPLGIYRNQNGLVKGGSNAYNQTAASGAMEMVDAGSNGSGVLMSGTIENSNVEEAKELANLIQNKQFYNMNTKSWQTGNELLSFLLAAASS